MSSPARVLAILDLFTVERAVWNLEAINAELGYTRTSGYRYLKELVELGYLQKVAKASYALGPKIIQLDYQLRNSDPLLISSQPVMTELAQKTGFDAILSVQFPQACQIIDTCRISVQPELVLEYGRGRPRPFLKSASPKVLLSTLKPAQLRKVYEQFTDEIVQSEMGPDFEAFRAYLRKVRKQGYYLSLGELELGIGAMAVPVYRQVQEVLAALALVGAVGRFEEVDTTNLLEILQGASGKITAGLASGTASSVLSE